MAAFDSFGNYILYATGSKNPTRMWNRAETSGTDICAPRVHEKLKYYVLKHPPATAAPVALKSNAPTIQIGKATYAIDPTIYSALLRSIAISPVLNLIDLQARIKTVRAELGEPAPISLQLADIPLSQYKRRYTYQSSASSYPVERFVNKIKNMTPYSYPFALGDFVNFPELNQLPRFGLFKQIFVGFPLNYDLARYFYVSKNDNCLRTNKINDLFPGNGADLFGASILSVKSIELYNRRGIKFFFPTATTLVHGSTDIYGGKNPIELGIIIGINGTILRAYNLPITTEFLRRVDENSQFIFIPVKSQLDLIEYMIPPNGSGITFPDNNGGDFSREVSIQYNERLSTINFHTNVGYKKLVPTNKYPSPYLDINFDINKANADINSLG